MVEELGNDNMDVVEIGKVRGGNSSPNVGILLYRLDNEQPFYRKYKMSVWLNVLLRGKLIDVLDEAFKYVTIRFSRYPLGLGSSSMFHQLISLKHDTYGRHRSTLAVIECCFVNCA